MNLSAVYLLLIHPKVDMEKKIDGPSTRFGLDIPSQRRIMLAGKIGFNKKNVEFLFNSTSLDHSFKNLFISESALALWNPGKNNGWQGRYEVQQLKAFSH